MSTPHKRTIAALRRRLERMELEHLREHALALHEQLEAAQQQLKQTQQELYNADVIAECWRDQALELQRAVDHDTHATHRCVGLAKTGELMVVRLDA